MQTRVFKSGNSQAVRIPRELSFPEGQQDVLIERRGDELVIRPLRSQKLCNLGQHLQAFSAGFMAQGRLPEPEAEREGWQ